MSNTAKREIYLDNSATTRCFPEVGELVRNILTEEYGNPSSMHHKGVEAERILTNSRNTLAEILKVSGKNLVFTSCGTESDNLAIIGCARAYARDGRHLVTTVIEHPAVLEAMKYLEGEGYEVTYLPVDRYGVVSPDAVADAVRPDTILVSVMHTNNEIGSLQPIAEIGERIKQKNPKTLFHVDAVQGFGKALIYPKRMKIDLLSASGHKIHAPKGIGLLYLADGVKLRPILYGGGQQGGLRSGTENVAGIAAMAMAAKRLYRDFDSDLDRLYDLKERLITGATGLEGVTVNGKTGRESAPHVVSLSIQGIRAEVLLHALEDKGIYVSSGSACSSNRPHLSETLKAIGVPRELMDSTIRLSLSVMNTEEEIDEAVSALSELLPFLRKYTRK